jgi:hypothetical protein
MELEAERLTQAGFVPFFNHDGDTLYWKNPETSEIDTEFWQRAHETDISTQDIEEDFQPDELLFLSCSTPSPQGIEGGTSLPWASLPR